LAPILGVACAPRFYWIGRFDRLHGLPKVGVRETVPRPFIRISGKH
jgi:hypothetical protein